MSAVELGGLTVAGLLFLYLAFALLRGERL